MAKTYSKLHGRIVEKYGTVAEFARVADISRQAIGAKLDGDIPFSKADMSLWCALLDIESSEILNYFFCDKDLAKLN